jgi:BirA family biotin operon repressor/biotin-[acetyl-CoA-carboxylase] ligase
MTPDQVPPDLAAALVQAGDRLGPFTGRIIWYDEVGSTNDVAASRADRGAEEGVVVLAGRQTAGRGRLGRTWVSPAGAGIYASMVLRPSPEAAALLTIAAGVAVATGIEAATGLGVQLKWPNDVQAGGRKLAGILAEGSADHVVLGVGINVLPAAFPPDVAQRATSLEGELGRTVDRGLVLAECLAAMADQYGRLRREGGTRLIEAWRLRAAATLGRHVEWETAGERRVGLAENIDPDGALVVRSGTVLVRVRSGEVRWL